MYDSNAKKSKRFKIVLGNSDLSRVIALFRMIQKIVMYHSQEPFSSRKEFLYYICPSKRITNFRGT